MTHSSRPVRLRWAPCCLGASSSPSRASRLLIPCAPPPSVWLSKSNQAPGSLHVTNSSCGPIFKDNHFKSFHVFFSFWNVGLVTIHSTDNSTTFSPMLPPQTCYCSRFPQHYQQAHRFHQRGHTSDHIYRTTISPIFIHSLVISFIPELQLSLFTFLFLWSSNITTFSPAMYLLSACHSSGYNINSLATFILDTEHFPTSLHELFAGKTNFTSFYFTFPLTV